MSDLITKVRAALDGGKKLTRRQLRDIIDCEPGELGSVITRLKERNEVQMHEGDGPKGSLYSLNPEGQTAAPDRKSRQAPPHKKGSHRKKAKPASMLVPAHPRANGNGNGRNNVVPFIPAMTADRRLVIIGGSQPVVFSEEQTQSIADLMAGHFEAA